MNKKNWKNGIALGLALAIVLGTGVLNSANWLHAGEAEAAPEAAATEAAPAQGATVTETIVVPEAPAPTEAPAPAPTEAPAEPAQPQSQVTEQIQPTEPVQETKPVEETKPAEETKPVEESKPTEQTEPVEKNQSAEQTEPTEETESTEETEATEETEPSDETEPTEQTQPEELPLPAADLPVVVTLVDAQGQSVGQGKWESTVTFAEGETTARLTPPQIEGYTAPELTVERTAETTALEVQAVYQLAEKTPEQLLAEALNPNRSVAIKVHTDADVLYNGDTVRLEAVLSGYDNVTYTIQWRYSVDNQTWHDCTGETDREMQVVLNEDNYCYYWNVLVTVTGMAEQAPQTEPVEAV